MNIVITGLPGAGKGTQAEEIIKKYNIQHLSTGNIMRSFIEEKNELGMKLESYIKEGKLVPDELTAEILKEEISKDKYKNGVLIDGYPRNIQQVEKLNEIFNELKLEIDAILYLDIDEQIVIDRLSNRLTCPNCQSTFNKITNKPRKENICDNCSSQLETRKDDKLESIKTRMKIAKEQTVPVVSKYQENTKINVITIDCSNDTIDIIFDKISIELDKLI